MKKNRLFQNSALVTAVLASLCCITPVLAILGGLGGIASAFTWLEPFRPYLIGLSVIALGAAFYQAYKPKPAIECECEKDEKTKFINSKGFLWTILFVSVALYTFPSYSGVFFPEVTKASSNNSTHIVEAKLDIEGMSCTGCENSINYALKTEDGVLAAESSYKTGVAKVKFDETKVDMKKLKKAVTEKAGYKVKSTQILSSE